MTNIIYEDDDVLCSFYQGDSPYLLITFAPANFNMTNSIPFWGYEFSSKNHVTTIGIVAKNNNWYPDASIKKLSSCVSNYSINYSDIISYGTSMGGYGAMKHGKMLGATHTIAFAPQYSIDPQIMLGQDTRYSEYFTVKNKGSFIEKENITRHSYIIYDPYYREDCANVQKINDLSSDIELLRAPFMHHFPLELFVGSKRTLELFALVLLQNKLSIENIIRRRRKYSETRIRYLIELLAARNPNVADSYYSKYNSQLKDNGNAWLCGVISDSFQKADYIDKAKHYALLSIELVPENITFLRRLSSLHLKCDEFAEALLCIKKAIKIKPDDVNLLNVLVSIYLKMGDKNKAFNILLKAIKLAPTNRDILARITSVSLFLDKTDQSLKYATLFYENSPNDFLALSSLLKTYERRGDLDKFLTISDAAVEKFGISKVADLYLRVCFSSQQVDFADLFINKFIKESWGDILSPNVLYQMYMVKGENELAEKVLLEELASNPCDLNLLFRLCTVNGKMGNKQRALYFAHRAWKVDESSLSVSVRYISTLIWFGEKQKALELISDIEKRHPNNPLIEGQRARL